MSFSQAVAPADFPAKQVGLKVEQPRGNRAPDYSKVTSGSVDYSKSSHIGLMWTRYQIAHANLDEQCNDWVSLSLPGDSADDRKKALNTWSGYGALDCFKRSAKSQQLPKRFLKQLLERRKQVHDGLGNVETLEAKSQWRSAVGLGNASTFENSGITLHATYGFPILPAASLKGVARHFLLEDPELMTVDQTLRDEGKRLESLHQEELGEVLFGKRDASLAEGAGEEDHLAVIRLYDGWPTQRPSNGWFDIDVLTVQHKQYYECSVGFAVDSESPVPVHFLTLQPGVLFSIPIGLTSYGRKQRNANPTQYLSVAKAILQSALLHFGIGAKTASGFGRMSPS